MPGLNKGQLGLWSGTAGLWRSILGLWGGASGLVSGGGGTPPNTPAFSLDFTTGSLDSKVTASGGANGTRVNASGAIVAATTPRFDYDPVTLASRGVLIEEARTNLKLWSEVIWNGGWSVTGADSNEPLTDISPSGGLAPMLFEDESSGNHGISRTVVGSSASAVNTFSSYLKPAGRTKFRWMMADASTGALGRVIADFDLVAMTVVTSVSGTGSGVSATIVDAGGGYRRCTVTGLVGQATEVWVQGFLMSGTSITYPGDNVSGMVIWGNQLEQGAFATSYIPTTTAAVTRTQDVLTVTGTNFSSWYNATAGTFVAKADGPVQAGTPLYVMAATDSADLNTQRIFFANGSLNVTGTVLNANINQGPIILGTRTPNVAGIAAFAYALNDMGGSWNGNTTVTDNTMTVPAGIDRLCIGNFANAFATLNGHVHRIEYYSSRLPNAQLESLSYIPTPPVFTVQPSISPSSGTVGATFTATDGTASNTTGYTRRWLLGGTSIGTGTTVVPVAAGSLVLEVTATGAGGSTIATSPAATVSAGGTHLNLDFTTGSLPSGVTATGGANGTRYSNTGVIVAASAPRFDYGTAGTNGGIMNEPARTNLCLQSGRVDLAPWGVFFSGGPIMTVTAQSATAPDGTNNAARAVTGPAQWNAQFSLIYQIINVTVGQIYRGSLWVKGAVGGETAYIYAAENTGGKIVGFKPVTATTSWVRHEYFFTSANGDVQLSFGYNSNTTVEGYVLPAITGGTFYLWGSQLEVGPASATSYIPTTSAAVTRSADAISMTVPGGDDTLFLTYGDTTVQYLDAAGATTLPTNLYQPKIKTITSQALPSTPITGVNFGTRFKYNQVAGHTIPSDVWQNAWAQDNEIYAVSDDLITAGWDTTDTAFNYNTMLHRLIAGAKFDTSFRGELAFGAPSDWNQFGRSGQLGADGRNWKSTGLGSYDGRLYAFINRHKYANATDGWDRQSIVDNQIVKSADFGYHNTPLPPTAGENYASPMFPGTVFPGPSFIAYGKDNQNCPHRGNEFAYATSTNGYYYNGDSMILARCLRTALPNLSAANWQYWKGGDWQLDASWTTTAASAVPILTNSRKLNTTNIQYIPAYKRYIMFQWYFQGPLGSGFSGVENATMDIYEGPNPTAMTKIVTGLLFDAAHNAPPGIYGTAPIQKSINADGGKTFYLACTGNFNSQNLTTGEYTLQILPVTLLPTIAGFDAQFNTSPALVYSEGDRLVVRSDDNARLGLRGLTGHETGKWYAELLPIGARLRFAGIVDDTFSIRGAGGDAGTNRAGIEGSSLVGYPHVSDPIGEFASPGVVVRFAYYADIDQFWLKLGDGDWNSDPSASPVSGLGGLSASGLVGAGYVGVTLRPVIGAGVRIRLPGDPGYNLPAGYEEWSS